MHLKPIKASLNFIKIIKYKINFINELLLLVNNIDLVTKKPDASLIYNPNEF